MTISKQIYVNNAKTTLLASLAPSDVSISVSDGSAFPSPLGGQFFLVSVEAAGIVEIIKCTGRTGNTLTGCTRAQEGTSATSFSAGARVENRLTGDSIQAFARLIDRLDEVASVDLLAVPSLSNSNSYVCHSNDDGGNPVVAFKKTDSSWRFNTHNYLQLTGSIDSGTSTSVTCSAITSSVISGVVSGKYIIQFITGANAGLCRTITSTSTGVVSWSTALPETQVIGDQFEIYQSNASITSALILATAITGEWFSNLTSITTTGTLTTADLGTALSIAGSSTTQTLPPAASCFRGSTLTFIAISSFTIQCNAAETATVTGTGGNSFVINAGEFLQLVSTTTGWIASSFNRLSAAGYALLAVTQVWTAAQSGQFVSVAPVSSGATLTLNFSLGNNFVVGAGENGGAGIAANFILGNPSNIAPGQSGMITFVQDVTGSRVISSRGDAWIGNNGTHAGLSAGASGRDTFYYAVDYDSKIQYSAVANPS